MDSQSLVREISFPPQYGWLGNGRSCQIRPALPLDRETIIANINAIGAEDFYFPSNRYVPTPEWEAALNDRPDKNDKRLLAVVEVNGLVIGHGRLFSAGFGHKDTHVIDVGIGLLKPYRGLGIGKELLAYLIEWAEQAGYEKMTATIMSTNVRTQRLFAHHQFKCEGTRLRQFKVGQKYIDELLVAKFL
jgi:RimJ/RimL family protein N-acetyltransferase